MNCYSNELVVREFNNDKKLIVTPLDPDDATRKSRFAVSCFRFLTRSIIHSCDDDDDRSAKKSSRKWRRQQTVGIHFIRKSLPPLFSFRVEGKAISGLCCRCWRVPTSTSFFHCSTNYANARAHACLPRALISFASVRRRRKEEREEKVARNSHFSSLQIYRQFSRTLTCLSFFALSRARF